ncbi:hypothetical protein [Hymenobacter crusticola]|uniref:DUF1772 domain-containing protein n=1 Tax=Hymenobacter crusticola TaxID=1770526 RepID=A0A243W8K5_9BACT|nr:hypothetical protein [Hymenobacter crusticola]OUJ71649.1 hypothetical protein BXP70_21455 [Hymenobacter crusticola]
MPLPLLLLLNFALAAYLTGVIWTVQLVHYPGFGLVAPQAFDAYHKAHLARMGWVVMAPMIAEALLACLLVWAGRALGSSAWWSLGLVVFIWSVTFLVSVPFHNRLVASGFNYIAIDGLTRTNWLRTLAWTARMVLLGWLLFISMR